MIKIFALVGFNASKFEPILIFFQIFFINTNKVSLFYSKFQTNKEKKKRHENDKLQKFLFLLAFITRQRPNFTSTSH